MDTGLKGKAALITGGGVGIGFGIAKYLADEGVDIAVANRGEYPDAVKEIHILRLAAPAARELEGFLPTWETMLASIKLAR